MHGNNLDHHNTSMVENPMEKGKFSDGMEAKDAKNSSILQLQRQHSSTLISALVPKLAL